MMPPTKFTIEALFAEAGPAKPVPVPLSEPVSAVQSISLSSSARPTNRLGVWECSPGVWRRQVVQAEFCHFLSGRAIFYPDEGEPIAIGAGDVVHFPENSAGHWDILEQCRKIFLVFDEGPTP
jgi:uncharacterized cupin superfamily protein